MADLDVTQYLQGGASDKINEINTHKEMNCFDECKGDTKSVSENSFQFVSITNWEELLDVPENLGGKQIAVARTGTNDIQTIAVASLASQLGYSCMFIDRKSVSCLACFVGSEEGSMIPAKIAAVPGEEKGKHRFATPTELLVIFSSEHEED